jgi:hypothetical protein
VSVLDVPSFRQIEVHTAEQLVPGPTRLEFEIDLAKLKEIYIVSKQIPTQNIAICDLQSH